MIRVCLHCLLLIVFAYPRAGLTQIVQLQNPRPTASDLFDITFVGASQAWAVGEFGTILHTTNSGIDWTIQNGQQEYRLDCVSFCDSQHGWASGDTILRTTDSGNSWVGLSYDDYYTVLSTFFLSPTTGWLLSYCYDSDNGRDSSRILKTNDGGDTWSAQASLPNKAYLTSIQFADARNGWVCGYRYIDSTRSYIPLLYRTTNGGSDWLPVTVETQYLPLSLSFVDSSNGWFVARNSHSNLGCDVYYTSDGGINWVLRSHNESNQYLHIVFVDRINGWVSGEYFGHGVIAKTSDGGMTWTTQTLVPGPLSFSIYGLAASSSTNAIAVSLSGAIYGTTDGTIWNTLTQGFHAWLTDIQSIDRNHAWTIGRGFDGANGQGRPIVLRTADGGATWSEGQTNAVFTDYFSDIAFRDANNGWMCKGNQYLYRTTDGGVNWEQRTIDPQLQYIYQVECIGNHVWVYGNSRFFRSTNNGSTWSRMNTNFDFHSALQFIDETNGWGVHTQSGRSDSTIMYRTTDGGVNWSQIYNNSSLSIPNISFCDQRNGWACTGLISSNVAVMHTTDGGLTWMQQTAAIHGSPYQVYAIDSNRAWVCSSWGGLLKTSNAGTTWTNVDQNFEVWDFMSLTFGDAGYGWVVGEGGVILRILTGDSVEIIDNPINLPHEFLLHANYPNPFNGSTVIHYSIPVACRVDLRIFDMNGRLVKTLVDEDQKPGEYYPRFYDSRLASGTYVCRLQAGNYQRSMQMIHVK